MNKESMLGIVSKTARIPVVTGVRRDLVQTKKRRWLRHEETMVRNG